MISRMVVSSSIALSLSALCRSLGSSNVSFTVSCVPVLLYAWALLVVVVFFVVDAVFFGPRLGAVRAMI